MLDKAEAAKLDTALAGIEKRAKGLVSRGITKQTKSRGLSYLELFQLLENQMEASNKL